MTNAPDDREANDKEKWTTVMRNKCKSTSEMVERRRGRKGMSTNTDENPANTTRMSPNTEGNPTKTIRMSATTDGIPTTNARISATTNGNPTPKGPNHDTVNIDGSQNIIGP